MNSWCKLSELDFYDHVTAVGNDSTYLRGILNRAYILHDKWGRSLTRLISLPINCSKLNIWYIDNSGMLKKSGHLIDVHLDDVL